MEKYSKEVSERYSQFEKREAHPMEKYVGRHVTYNGRTRKVVGYSSWSDGLYSLIVGCPQSEGWSDLAPSDVIFKECESYWYTNINNLID